MAESEEENDGFPGQKEWWLAQDGDADPNVDSEDELTDGQAVDDELAPELEDSDEEDGFGPKVADGTLDDSDEEQDRRFTDLLADMNAPVENGVDKAINDLIDRSFRAAQMSLTPRPIVMPWETGVAAGVFNSTVGTTVQERLYRPEFRFPVNVPPAEVDPNTVERQKAQKQSSFPLATRRIKDMLATDSSDLLRSRALGRWKQILQLCPEASDLGRLLLREVQHLKDDASLLRI